MEGVDDLNVKDTLQVLSAYVPVNARTLQVSASASLKKGDRIMVTRPSSKEWIASLGCDIFGGGISALGWKAGDTDLTWDRTISEVDGNQITIDAPLTVALDAQYGASVVTPYQWNGRIQECGIENMTLVSDYDKRYPKDEDHCWTGISIANAENCWVRRINFKHFPAVRSLWSVRERRLRSKTASPENRFLRLEGCVVALSILWGSKPCSSVATRNRASMTLPPDIVLPDPMPLYNATRMNHSDSAVPLMPGHAGCCSMWLI